MTLDPDSTVASMFELIFLSTRPKPVPVPQEPAR